MELEFLFYVIENCEVTSDPKSPLVFITAAMTCDDQALVSSKLTEPAPSRPRDRFLGSDNLYLRLNQER